MKFYLSVILLLLLAACARPPEPLWVDIPAAETLLEKLSSRSGTHSTLDATASVSVTLEGRHISSQQFIMAQSPDRVRVDALSGFGQLIMQLATDGDVLTVFLNTSVPPRFFRGEATMENFSRFVRLPLPPELLVAALLYDPPILDFKRAVVHPGGKVLELHLSAESFLQIFYFDQQFQLTGTDYLQNEEVLFSIKYSQFSTTDAFPRRIALRIPAKDAVLAMRISELELNVNIPAAKFVLQAPAGITPEPIP